jgi:membrane protease YdiL (CAAX protease family)
MICVIAVEGYIGNWTWVELRAIDADVICWILAYVFKPLSTLAIFAIVFRSVQVGHWSLSRWGFLINRRLPLSLLPMAAFTAFIFWVHPETELIAAESWWLLPKIAYASVEELIFRAVVINLVAGLVPWRQWRGVIAIGVSVAAFTFVHIPTRAAWQLEGLVLLSLLMGWTYYYTRSLLFPLWAHVVGNTFQMSGLLGGMIVVVVYFGLVLLAWRLEGRRATAGQFAIEGRAP